MAETYRLTGQDTIVLWGRVMSDFADGIQTAPTENHLPSVLFSFIVFRAEYRQ